MHPSKKKSWDPHLGSELSQAWSQLDKTRKELRRMEHRVGDLGEGLPTSNHSAYLRPTGTVVSTTSEVERSRSEHSLPLNARREPLARSVDPGVRPSRPQQSHGAKRKISRLDKHATEPRGKIGSGTSRRQQHPRDGAPRSSSAGEASGGKHSRPSASATNVTSGAPVTLNLAGSSLKRVDFSERLRLREVRWDGTIRDSVARPPPPPATNGENATFSVPAALADASLSSSSLSSFSSSSVARPVDSFSTLTDSRALRETEIRFLNDNVVEQERPRGRAAARLTHVQVEVPGGSGHEHAKGTQRGHEVVGDRDREDRVSSRGIVGGRAAASGHGGGGGAAFLSRDQPVSACANMINSDSERPTARRDGGGEWGGATGGPSEGPSGATSSRMQKIKKTLKDLPNDECVLAKLREKIRRQRLSASSSDTSHSESSTLGHSDSSREPTPQHVLHELHEPILVGEGRHNSSLTPDKVPRTRKVASGPPLPSYKGFSEVPFDPSLQAKVRQINWLSAPKKKSMQKPTNPAQAGIQTHVKFTPSAASSAPSVPATSSTTTDKTRKVGRIVAPHQNNSSKPGAKDIITTSSWRTGQELVLRELGTTKTRSHSTDRNNSGGVHRGGSNNEEDHRQVQLELGDLVDNTQLLPTAGDHYGPVTCKGADGTEQLARSRALSEDAKKMLQDLQLDNEEKERRSISFRRPAVKRKAPKPEKESDEHTAHKHKHYDSESVRQYIAKQKAQRQQQKEAQRKAEMEEAQKRQQLMQDLIAKQKSAAMSSKPRKGNRSCKNHASVPPDQDCNAEQNSHLLVSSHADKENVNKDGKMDVSDDEESDADTLTGSNDEGSTPRATPIEKRDHISRAVQEETATELYHSLFQRLKPPHQHQHHAVRQPPTDAKDPNRSPHTESVFIPAGASKFPARVLNLDVDTVLSRFAQVVDQRRSYGARVGLPGGGAENGFMLGPSSLDSNDEKLREEKLKVLKANSQTLQNKLAHVEKSIKTVVPNDSGSYNMEEEFVSHHERIAGSRDKYSVFTSNLPGTQTVDSRHSDSESANDVRASRLASREAGNALGLQRDNYLALRKVTPPAASVPEKADEDSSVTEVSTFSEITAADESSSNTISPKVVQAVADKPVAAGMQYKAPSAYKWEEPKADPYSVLNVFSRQVHHGSRALRLRESDQPADNASETKSNTAVVKDPIITSTQHIVSGHTSRGHHVVAKTTYTRMEATLLDRNQTPQQATSSRNRATRSDERGPLSSVAHTSAPSLSMSDDSRSLESAEEDMPKPAFSKQGMSGKFASGFQRQTSDTGQETDVSQMSEDEPRTSLKTFEGVSSVSHPQAEAKWSPAALERQMAAELARLESLGDSLQQLSSMERTRAVALAQQETVSLAQILKARQQEHSAELRSLQLQVQEERLASAKELQQQLHNMASSQQRTAEAATSVTHDKSKSTATVSKQLLEQAENRRPETKVSSPLVSRSRSWNDTDYSETATSTPLPKPMPKSHSRYSYTSSSRTKSVVSENVKTAEDTRSDSDSSIQTASDVDTHKTDASIAEEVPDGDYSMSFDDSLTEEESFKQVLPSESHRKDARRRKSDNFQTSISKDEATSLALGDLTSLFTGEDSFSRFTAGMVRQIMREEELRSQHQAALLKLREKALKEKTKAELAWLKQQRQRLRDKGADDVYPQLDHKEQTLLKHLQEQQAEIRHLREANRLASKERQSLLKQHEEIARMQQETRQKLKTLQKHGSGRLGRPAEVHTEDEANLVEELSDANEDTSLVKTAKSDSEMYGDLASQRKPKGEKQNIRKQQKLRLDQKYLTAREQKLMERKKQASELLKWKLDLDAEEEKVMQLERSALQAWGTRTQPADKKHSKDVGKDSNKNPDNKIESLGNLRPETATRPETVATSKEESLMLSRSEAISTHISVSKSERTDHRKMHTETSGRQSNSSASYSPQASGSESSIPEDIPDGPGTSRPTSGREKQQMLDSSDETVINSSVNEEEEADGPAHDRGKKSSVGRLLPPGNSPLPVPWSRKTGSESESEESVSHTETVSDVSDYEARIRQLSDLLQRRRKEADMLKKERSRRKKDKLKAQEESLKKQLEAYENFIAQVKAEQVDLEHEAGRPTVRPQIKQPKSSPSKSSIALSSSSPSPSGRSGHRDEGSNSSSMDEARDSAESNQTSPALSEGQDSKISPLAEKEKTKKKTATFMDRISEGSESRSEQSPGSSAKSHSITNKNHSISEDQSVPEVIEDAIDENSQLISIGSGHSHSGAFTIKTSLPSKVDEESKIHNSLADDAHSYSMDFTEGVSQSLGHSHNRKLPSARSDASHGSGQGIRSEAEISECIESAAASSAKSMDNSLSSPPKLILMKSPTGSNKDISTATPASSHPVTGIQESDSENESRINSHRSLSRPSSERSTGSTTFSDMHDFEEEEDVTSSESDRTPVRAGTPNKEVTVQMEMDLSVSASLPSLSEKRLSSKTAQAGQHESLDAQLGDLLGLAEDEATPTHTPRVTSPLLDQEENSSLMLTDPLADFHEGDSVLVGGVLLGRLRFKGTVAFAPGFWAGVELDKADGDMSGECEGVSYFHCKPKHGVLVPGSEISLVEEVNDARDGAQSRVGMFEDAVSLDNSFTDQDDVSSATEGAEPVKTTVSAVVRKALDGEDEGEKMPVSNTAPHREKENFDILADSITEDMTQSLMHESIERITCIASRQSSPVKVPPATLPKPVKSPHQTSPKPKWNGSIDIATSAMVGGLLDDALTKMIQIRRGQQENSVKEPYDAVLVNWFSDDSGVEASRDSSRDGALPASPDLELVPGGEPKEFEDAKCILSAQPLSSELFHRPKSPVPSDGLSSQEREDLDGDISSVLGLDTEYIDDDFGLGKLPPPYPGSGDNTTGEQVGGGSKPLQHRDFFAVPHERAEVETIVAEAVEIYWNLRRCGEPWESVSVPASFLQEAENEETTTTEPRANTDIVTCSRRSYRHLLFDLTGEILRDIYQYENEVDPPAWQKPVAKRQRYYKGITPPTTVDVLLPVVQTAAISILGLNGAIGKMRGKTVNKWSVRKKKDHVDAVLVKELQEEEADWISYNHDETAVKLQLTDTIFESLLADTVDALNRIYTRRQVHSQH